jgi:hypothetical protein
LAALESLPVSDDELVAATGVDFSVVDVVESDLSSDVPAASLEYDAHRLENTSHLAAAFRADRDWGIGEFLDCIEFMTASSAAISVCGH